MSSVITKAKTGRATSLKTAGSQDPQEFPEQQAVSNCIGVLDGDWLQHVSATSNIQTPSTDLLRQGAVELPGNIRYAWDGLQTLLIGEVPIPIDSEDPLHDARTRLHELVARQSRPAGSDESAGAPDPDLIAMLLAESGHEFQNRDRGCVLPAQHGLSEVTIGESASGVWVETELARWEQIESVSREALSLFLARAHRWIRFARCVMHDQDARIGSLAETVWIETDLVMSVNSVVAAAARLRRAAGALCTPQLAQAYLSEHGTLADGDDADRTEETA